MIVNNDLISINEWQYFIEIVPVGIVNKMQINNIVGLLLNAIGTKYLNNEVQYKYQIIKNKQHGYILRLQVYIYAIDITLPLSIYILGGIHNIKFYPNLELGDKCKFINTSGVFLYNWNYIIRIPDNW